MWSRTVVLFVLAVLLGSLAASARGAHAYPVYGWRDCWVTMTGLGVCAPRAYDYPPVVRVRPRRLR